MLEAQHHRQLPSVDHQRDVAGFGSYRFVTNFCKRVHPRNNGCVVDVGALNDMI